MNIKDIGKGLRKLGKSKIAKEITEEVTEEGLESITNELLKKNKELLNSVGNQWKKEAIDTAGAMSHLPEIKPVQGALRNKGESVISKSPLRVMERTGKYRSGYDVVGMSSDFDIEGVIKSRNARNYLIGSLDVGPFETRYLLGGKAKKTPENKLLGDRVSFNVNAQNYIDNGVDAPYWVRKRAGRANVKPKQEVKNRRKGNREIKEIPVNNSTHQEQQLLLDAPVQKEPRKPRKEYKSDLGTNIEPIELPGPTKNRRRGNRPVNRSTQQDPQLLLEAPKQKSPRREYKPDLGTNKEPISLSGPVESTPQSKPEPKNKQVDVSIDDFKPADEIEKMDIENDNEIDVTHLFEEEEPKKVKSRTEEYTDKLEELETKYSNGDITDIEYAEEQQRLQDIFEKENPIDVSNVLSDQKEAPFSLDDFSMPNIDEVDIEKKLWKDTEKQKLPKEAPYTKSDTYDLNLKRESRYYLTEDKYFDQVDRIEEMYNNGELTDQEYADELNRAKKDYVPELVD